MKTYNSVGTICLKGPCNLTYKLCKIEYILNEDETYKYIFTPNYSVMELLDSYYFQGIPGINLDLKKEVYIRENRIPTFISERVPQKNREDYYELLEKVNMEYMDPILYLIRTTKKYSGDNLYVVPFEEKITICLDEYKTNDITREIIKNICLGNNIEYKNQLINDENRKEFHDLFLGIYSVTYNSNKAKQKEGIEKAKKDGKYIGRKPISVDKLRFLELLDEVNNKKITSKEAANKLGISIDKYYRLRKELQN